jgi:uncharacterized protein (DUF2147 family)
MLRLRFVVAAIATAAAAPACAGDPSGTWLVQDRKAKVRIAPCGNAMCGSVVWLSQPTDLATGKPLTDNRNPDPGKRGRPIIGIPVLIDMRRDGRDGRWHGRIYNPEDGNTYNGSIESAGTQLRVRGCVAFFCETKIWTRTD